QNPPSPSMIPEQGDEGKGNGSMREVNQDMAVQHDVVTGQTPTAPVSAAYWAAKQIEADLGVDRILQELSELPEAIRRQQEAVRAARLAVDEARTEAENAEALLMAEITAATDDRTGKPVFSNDTARKAELARRKTT